MLLKLVAVQLALIAVISGLRRENIRNVKNVLVSLEGGKFRMGIDDAKEGRNGESPSFESGVKPFQIDPFPVTNAHFKAFRDAKPKVLTDAESRGWSVVFAGHLNSSEIKSRLAHNPDLHTAWMVPIKGAQWDQPFGNGSNIEGLQNHPVVHVSKRDAAAFCFWAGKRLPTEFEWEYAARGGLEGLEYPWGDSYEKGRVNLWQGTFPTNDTGADGYAGTSPVFAYGPQNNYGLYDMVGNVWEWTKTPYHELHETPKDGLHDHYVIKGGSYLDSRRGDVNLKVRNSARDWKLITYAASNLGFRCVKSKEFYKPQKTSKVISTRPFYSSIHSEL